MAIVDDDVDVGFCSVFGAEVDDGCQILHRCDRRRVCVDPVGDRNRWNLLGLLLLVIS